MASPIIKFEYISREGEVFRQESPLWDDELGELDGIGCAFNVFLRLLTYVRKNDYILMEDLTENEWYYLQNALDSYRSGECDLNAPTEEEGEL